MVKETLEQKIDKLTAIVEKGFGAIAEDITDIKGDITVIKGDIIYIKEDLFGLHSQVNSIETDIRGMKHSKLEFRVADLEEKVFGKVRA